MKEIFRRMARVLAAVTVLATLASVAYTLCYSNVTVYYSDGTSQACGTFCVFNNGWLCR